MKNAEKCPVCERGTHGLSGNPKWCAYCGARLTGTPVEDPSAAGDALPSSDIEAAAQKMAECMGYPWAHMPEQGRTHMRKYAQAVIDAAIAAQRKGDA